MVMSPCPATSLAIVLVSAMMAALLAEYGPMVGLPSLPATEAMLTILPYLRARHAGQDRFAEQERPRDIDIQHLGHDFALEFPGFRRPARDPGVVDDDADGSQMFLDFVARTNDVGFRSDVTLNRQSVDLGGDFIRPFENQIESRDLGPRCCETTANGLADALPAAGYDRNFAVQPEKTIGHRMTSISLMNASISLYRTTLPMILFVS